VSHRISVILPTYNRAELVGETIDSLLAQSRPVDELLVIDDGSTDNTREVIARYGDAVKYLAKPNGGKASALNYGLKCATGDLIWICDDDDLLLPGACEHMARALSEDPELGFCAGLHEDFTIDEATGEMQIKAPGYQRKSSPEEIFPDLLDGCHIFQPGLLVRRSAYEQVGPFDETLIRSQDYEMLLRLARATRGRLLQEIVFRHREHQGERGSAGERFSMLQANAKWIRYHRLIMEPLMADLGDSEILPASIWNDPARRATRQRTAMLKRASIYARSQLWPEAAATWTQASAGFSGPLDGYEQSLVKGATLYSLGCDALLNDEDVRRTVLALKHCSELGRTIVSLVAGSLRWRLKQAALSGQLRQGAQMLAAR